MFRGLKAALIPRDVEDLEDSMVDMVDLGWLARAKVVMDVVLAGDSEGVEYSATFQSMVICCSSR
jgi:hypothetical protein